ncbi:hypothetical protein FF38_00121 [Lucilia cuprina]|uniref:Uncharacterized protein n=1 Tax=Lucilia cuprina TaxID=7375 RepID=A0A0L0BL22_LUCCU|nr:hypothetical protein FF38_00121 [Lucilia cuprina]
MQQLNDVKIVNANNEVRGDNEEMKKLVEEEQTFVERMTKILIMPVSEFLGLPFFGAISKLSNQVRAVVSGKEFKFLIMILLVHSWVCPLSRSNNLKCFHLNGMDYNNDTDSEADDDDDVDADDRIGNGEDENPCIYLKRTFLFGHVRSGRLTTIVILNMRVVFANSNKCQNWNNQ